MHFYWLAIGILAVWRITHLIQAEDGPWAMMARFRRWTEGTFWEGLVHCFYCLSLWMALPLAYLFAESWLERLVLWPALSGGAILLERLTKREEQTLFYHEDPEEES